MAQSLFCSYCCHEAWLKKKTQNEKRKTNLIDIKRLGPLLGRIQYSQSSTKIMKDTFLQHVIHPLRVEGRDVRWNWIHVVGHISWLADLLKEAY